MQEVVQQIFKTEEKAAALVKEAEKKVSEIREKSEKEAETLLKKARLSAQQKLQSAAEEARLKKDKMIEKAREQALAEGTSFFSQHHDALSGAVKSVLDILISPRYKRK